MEQKPTAIAIPIPIPRPRRPLRLFRVGVGVGIGIAIGSCLRLHDHFMHWCSYCLNHSFNILTELLLRYNRTNW